MGSKLPTTLLRRPTLAGAISSTSPPSTNSPRLSSPIIPINQVRHATFVPRHRRPYQFTQLVQLSDGSTYTVRTTSPQALYKSAKDSRNHILWQPSNSSLKNVEVDEAGKLAAFRERYGRAWDADAAPAAGTPEASEAPEKKDEPAAPVTEEVIDPFDSLTDLISGFATQNEKADMSGLSAKEQAKKEKFSKKKK
ncbi:putative 50s ribosomal protein [Podospora australis]|uniref:50s ribosomal protein n=1 Tax=Podospora australis TaxID=1536484 RepID=A0AAN6WVP4_9PEZI|nr:putative 50s ribosomal protein [Podospora australis]